MTLNSACVVEIQCFVDNRLNYIVKELSILDLDYNSSQHWIFQPPDECDLNESSLRTNNWLNKYFHKIKWDDGDVDYDHLNVIIDRYLSKYKKILVKGLQKKRFLSHYSENVINLEDYGCPQIRELIMPSEQGTQCLLHSTIPWVCTHFRVYALSHWMRVNNLLEKL